MCLKDPYGRIIDYLRVSITDRCNLNCAYCRPGDAPFLEEKELLTAEEILTFCREAALLGIRHLRITGGEPLLRDGCCRLIKDLKALDGIESVTLTTNGTLLSRHLSQLKEALIDGINISMDTLDEEHYAALTGFPLLPGLLEAVRETVSFGIPVKINSVIMDGRIPVTDYLDLAELSRSLPVDIRFIEAMPLGGSLPSALDHRKLLSLLSSRYPGIKRLNTARGFGPAVYYAIPGFSGCIGFINAVHGNFCGNCNRIRLTARGVLKSCLGYEGTICIKPLFGEDGSENALRQALLTAVAQKPACHHFGENHRNAERDNMSKIGG